MAYRYDNLDPAHRPHGLKEVVRWGVWERYIRPRRIQAPGAPAPRVTPNLERVHDSGGAPRLTWIGHASFLGSLGGGSFLIDPVFYQRMGFVCRRFGRPGLGPADLPPLDALLITHCHYDHLDDRSVRALPRATPVFVPRGLGRWFRRRGFGEVTELGWWEAATSGPLRITLVPSCHWSRRRIGDTNRTLWGGFVVEGGGRSFYHSGDSAWFDGFKEIGRRFPDLLAAMLSVGAYAPAWFMEHYHMNPEQSGAAFLDLGARHLVPMHWGAFKLTDEPLVEPAERIRAWWGRQSPDGGRRLHVPAVGQTLVFDERD